MVIVVVGVAGFVLLLPADVAPTAVAPTVAATIATDCRFPIADSRLPIAGA